MSLVAYRGRGLRRNGSLSALGANHANNLLSGLISYWKLEEASGQRNDSFGTNHLTDMNTVTQNPGKVGNAAQFTSASSEYLTIVNNASLQTGDIPFTIAGWVYVDSLGADINWAGKCVFSAPNREWMFYKSSGNSPVFRVFTNAGATIVAAVDAFAMATGTWYFVRGWHDPDANTANIQVNDRAPVAASTGANVIAVSTAPLDIGRALASFYWNGRVDEFGFWKRLLTPAEHAWLYNGGLGRALL